jgi:hypothetical protein
MPPGFVPPCTVSAANFTAAWDGNAVTVTFDKTNADMRGCSNFTYTLQAPGAPRDCISRDEGDTPPPTDSLPASNCQAYYDRPGWNVEVTYKSARHDEQPVEEPVSGQPTPTPSSTP